MTQTDSVFLCAWSPSSLTPLVFQVAPPQDPRITGLAGRVIYVCVCLCMFMYVSVCVYVCICMYECKYICVYVCVCVYECVCVCVRMYVYMCVHCVYV